jgi:hydrogenase maturation factor
MRADTIFPTGKLPMDYLQQLLQRYAFCDDRLIAGPCVGEDVAVIDMGDRYMVIKTDPITFATEEIGWYAVHVNANDIATSGARPLWMLNTVLLPEGRTTPALVEAIMDQLHQACRELDIVLVGGHTEVTHGLDRPIVVGVMIGEVTKRDLLTTAGAQPGDAILLVKGIPIEATSLIAREKEAVLLERGYEPDWIARAQRFLWEPGISVLKAAQLAAAHPGVHAMHDPTEGGLATGIHELAHAAGAGAWVLAERIPILPEGQRLCDEFGLDPLGCIASGALLVAVTPEQADALQAAYERVNIPSAVIGTLTEAEKGLWLQQLDVLVPLPRFDVDEITRIF